jgi:putative glycosyltransferase
MKLSIVSTLYRSEPYVEEFVRRVSQSAGQLTQDFEIILVDDGSPDRSLDTAVELRSSFPQVKIVELSRNFGHHKAMMAGLEEAGGDLIFLIDVDLEEPPETLLQFHDEMKSGNWDVVYGVARKRQGGFVRRVGGKIAWDIIETTLPINVPRNQCTARLMVRPYVQALIRHKEQMTAIGGLWVITGFHQQGILIDKGCREETSYGFWRRMDMFVGSISAFSERPLYAVFFLGLSMFILSFLVGIYLIISRIVIGTALEGWISVMLSVWGLGGIVLLCLGMVGVYVSRIFIETKNRPYVIIRRKYGFPDCQM